MIFEDDILNYLYEKSPNGEPTELKDFLREKIEVRYEGNNAWKNWSIVWSIAILNSLHNQEFIYFLNKDQIKITDYGVDTEAQLKILQTLSIKAQLKSKGKEWVRGEKIYHVSYWNGRSSILNVIGSGIIALVVLGLQIRSCARDDKKDLESSNILQSRQLIESQEKEQQKQSYIELQNRIRAIEDSLKFSH